MKRWVRANDIKGVGGGRKAALKPELKQITTKVRTDDNVAKQSKRVARKYI